MLKLIPKINTERLIITVIQPDHIGMLRQFESDNRLHLQRWEPYRDTKYYSEVLTQQRVANNFKQFELGTTLPLIGLNKAQTKIICLCTFSNIVHGVFKACHLGYSVSHQEQGKGLMFEMLQASIDYAFDVYDLHRIMANYMPSNTRSQKLLNRLGFEKEGLAKSYLKIAGQWQDHVLTSKINRSA